MMRYHAPYMEWAKTRRHATYDLAGSNMLICSLDEIPGARAALAFSGENDNGYKPLLDAIAATYGVKPSQVTTANGTSGANFLAYAALLEPGDDVLVERPGYDPLMGAARLLGARTVRFDRVWEDGFRIDPDRVRAAMTPRTKLIVVTSPHNPTGVAADRAALDDVGRLAERAGAHVLVDEVYLDASAAKAPPMATRSDVFISTSSLTKSYGLSSLRCGWTVSSDEVATRIRRARDVVDGTGAVVAERLSVLAFEHLDRLLARAHDILEANRPLVRQFLASRPELEWVESVGTVVFPRIRGVEDASRFAERLLVERDTAIVPGRFFEAPAYFRLGQSGDTDRLRAGLERIAMALDEKGW
jgi:aspartate/methionine/tyrosine aminotransferase